MNISNFDDLLLAACSQPQPQRLLFVFANVELPDNCTEEQIEHFKSGQGGALVPMMCVDKRPEELTTFAELVKESAQFEQSWGVVFVAALSGSSHAPPSSEDAEAALQRMVDAIKRGEHSPYIPFDANGYPLQFR